MNGDNLVHCNWRQYLRRTLAAAGLLWLMPMAADAQVRLPVRFDIGGSPRNTGLCDFDIADNLGRNTYGNTIHLTGRPDAPTDVGEFYIINGNTPEGDVDKDGFGPVCTTPDTSFAAPPPGTPLVPGYTALFVQERNDLINVANPALAIPGEFIILNDFPRRLLNGEQAQVQVFVQVPQGTVAGRYVGSIEIRDNILNARESPTRDVLSREFVFVEVTVVEQVGFDLVEADDDEALDSVVVRGRAGQRASTAFRVANLGNVNLGDVRLASTDLRSESAIGLVIPAQNVTFSPPSLSSIQFGDTARVVVTVQLPRGILGGRYRGSIIVGSNAGPPGQSPVPGSTGTRQEVPIIAIVQSNRGVIFGNNPVRAATGDLAQIAFNADPGTPFQLVIFDMDGMRVYTQTGSVFAGQSTTGTPGSATNPQPGADFAVNIVWPLTNGRGESIASGMYLVVVESFVNGQRTQARDRLMVIR